MSYFVDILSRVGDIFLPSCSQVFSLLNVKFRSIFDHIKVQSKEGNPLFYTHTHTHKSHKSDEEIHYKNF